MKGFLYKRAVSAILAALVLCAAFTSCAQPDKSVDKKVGQEGVSRQGQASSQQETQPRDELTRARQQRLKGVLDDYIKKQDFNGTVLVGVDNIVLYTAAKGYSDRQLKTFNRPDTVYEIGSVTKQFTAAAVMMFAEKGKLSVTDKVSKYFPDYIYGDDVTIENLLNMTSGIPDYLNAQLYLCETGEADPKEKFTVKKLLSIINGLELEFEPGTQFSYSNTNFYLLGNIVEQLSGMKYEDFIQKKIFDPLSMTSASCKLSDATAKGYLESGEEGLVVDSSYFGPAGEITASAEDIFKWQCAFITGKVVNPATVEKILHNSGIGYGYGWFLSDDYYYHTGNTEAFYAIDLIGRNDDIRVVALSNEDDNATSELGQEIYKMTKAALFG